MTVAEFLDWAAGQPDARYELVEGQPVAMAGDTAEHNLVKAFLWSALNDAVRAAGLPCTVFTDGMNVKIGADTIRIPDASVQCGVEFDRRTMLVEAPLILVEVASPSSERDDARAKLIEYFSLPSVRHYLTVHPDKAVVIHHRREEDGDIRTRIVGSGDIDLTPPGIAVPVARLLGAA